MGGGLAINHKETGKEIETGNVNSKVSLRWVNLKAQAQSSTLKAGVPPTANKGSGEETAKQ